MIKISYNGKVTRSKPTLPPKKRKKKASAAKRGKLKTVLLKEDNLKIINALFGTLDGNSYKYLYEEVKFLTTNPDYNNNIHFVLGSDNRKFLLDHGVKDSNIVLVDKRPYVYSHFLCNKTFLLKTASEVFSQKDILFLDYDCALLKKMDKLDIYSKLKENKREIQCPPVGYTRRIFRNAKGQRLRHGLQTCLVYWSNHDIIKKWFELYSKNLEYINDEIPLLLVLEELYGKTSVDFLYTFDTPIIQTVLKPKTSNLYIEDKYKDAYFRHYHRRPPSLPVDKNAPPLPSKKTIIYSEKHKFTEPTKDEDKLKFIHVLFGEKQHFVNKGRRNRIYKEVLSSLRYPYFLENNIHFVLGEDNKKFLIDSGVPSENVILVDKKSSVHTACMYNKVFLLKAASEVLPKNDILFLDYDCYLIRDIDKKDIYKKLKKNKRGIQCPTIRYNQPHFRSQLRNTRQREGLQTCLVYWSDHYMIDQWMKKYTKNESTGNDEMILFLTLEDVYGTMDLKALYAFDTTIMKIKRRAKDPILYCEKKYEDAYFTHG